MHRRNDTAFLCQHKGEHPNTLVARSYQEIAKVLTEREGVSVSPVEVRELCRG